ncbi:tautomerase family protein [Pseudonocardia sp. ICBG1293]|uniref:tautomerase family protein n=1 Tax=Pseudonocardia sp. ICBG1293 TaxID=2844382 RepID=UPI001CC95E65|nr:tautomerase family protein [Pseudonocardia sp. ICBG1293]
MPFADLEVPAGLLDADAERELVEKVTDVYAATFGDEVRATTMVLVDEVVDGGWGIRGQVLTLTDLRGR